MRKFRGAISTCPVFVLTTVPGQLVSSMSTFSYKKQIRENDGMALSLRPYSPSRQNAFERSYRGNRGRNLAVWSRKVHADLVSHIMTALRISLFTTYQQELQR